MLALLVLGLAASASALFGFGTNTGVPFGGGGLINGATTGGIGGILNGITGGGTGLPFGGNTGIPFGGNGGITLPINGGGIFGTDIKLPFSGTFDTNFSLKAEMLFSIIPDYLKVFNMHRIVITWGAAPISTRAAFTALAAGYKATGNWNALLTGIKTIFPPLHAEIVSWKAASDARNALLKVNESHQFVAQIVATWQQCVFGMLAGWSDWSALPDANLIATFGKLPLNSKVDFLIVYPQFAISFEEAYYKLTSLTTANRPFLIYTQLPFVLQVAPVRNLLKSLWALTPIDRARLAVRFTLQNSYASIDQLIADCNAISPNVGAAINAINAYYNTQLQYMAIDATAIGKFRLNLAGCLLPILQGEVNFEETDAVKGIATILRLTGETDIAVLSELLYLQLPEFMKVLNMHQLFQAWGQVTVDLRAQINAAITAYRTSGDFDALIAVVGRVAPNLLSQYRLFVSEYTLGISRVLNADAVNFLNIVVNSAQPLFVSLLTGSTDLSFVQSTPIILAYQQLTPAAQQAITVNFPTIATSFSDAYAILTGITKLPTIDVNSQPSIVYAHLPVVLQTAPMQTFLNTLWSLPPIVRARLAAKYTINYGYANIGGFASDIRSFAPDLATAFEKLVEYYNQQLTTKTVPLPYINQFAFNLAAAVIPVIRGDFFFPITDPINVLNNIITNGANLKPVITDMTKDYNVIAQYYYNQLPDFFKLFNIRSIFTAWGSLNDAARSALSTALITYNTNKDIAVLIKSIETTAPGLAVQLRLLADGYSSQIGLVKSDEVKTFIGKLTDAARGVIIGMLQGQKEFPVTVTNDLVTLFNALSADAKSSFKLVFPSVTLAFQDLATGTVKQPDIIYRNLPTILQRPSIQALVNLIYQQTDVVRAQLAAKFAFAVTYSSFDQLITDANAIVPGFDVALQAVWSSYVTQFAGKAVNPADFLQFRNALAGALLPIFQGQIYYQPTTTVTTMLKIFTDNVDKAISDNVNTNAVIAQTVWNSLPNFLQIFNMHDIITLYHVTPVVVQEAIAHAVATFKITHNFEAFKTTLQMIHPDLATQFNLFIAAFNDKMTATTDAALQNFITLVLESSQSVILGLFSGVTDYSFVPTSALVLAYQQIPAASLTQFKVFFPVITTSFDQQVKELPVVIDVTKQPSIVFGRLPVVLQIPTVQNLLNVYWALSPSVRANLAAQFSIINTYPSFDLFLVDVKNKSPEIAAALDAVRQYYITLLRGAGNNEATITLFQTNLVGSLLPIIQGVDKFDHQITTTDTITNIISTIVAPPPVNITLNFGTAPWFFNFLKVPDLIQAYYGTNVIARNTINVAVTQFLINNDFNALISTVRVGAPDLYKVYQGIVDGYLAKISGVSTDVKVFGDLLARQAESVFVSVLQGKTDFSGFITDALIRGFGALSDANRKVVIGLVPDLGNGFQQAYTNLVNQLVVITADRINGFVSELPPILRIAPVQQLVITAYQLEDNARLALAARFAGLTTYASFAQLVTDVRAIAPTVADKLDAAGAFYRQTLTTVGAGQPVVDQFLTDLAGVLLQVLQNNAHFTNTLQATNLTKAISGISGVQIVTQPTQQVQQVVMSPDQIHVSQIPQIGHSTGFVTF